MISSKQTTDHIHLCLNRKLKRKFPELAGACLCKINIFSCNKKKRKKKRVHPFLFSCSARKCASPFLQLAIYFHFFVLISFILYYYYYRWRNTLAFTLTKNGSHDQPILQNTEKPLSCLLYHLKKHLLITGKNYIKQTT